jgi:hypothetical protein
MLGGGGGDKAKAAESAHGSTVAAARVQSSNDDGLKPPAPIILFPWITHTKPLHALLAKLTTEHTPQLIVDVERLFHSCRLNKAVTKATLQQLQKTWEKESNGDRVRAKILLIVDRLLDRCIFSQQDRTFRGLVQWLAHIESKLDHYRFPHCTNLLNVVLRKIARERLLPLSCVPHADLATAFDGVDVLYEYRYLMMEGPVYAQA